MTGESEREMEKGREEAKEGGRGRMARENLDKLIQCIFAPPSRVGSGADVRSATKPGSVICFHRELKLHLLQCIRTFNTRSSADGDNRLDAFVGQSRSTNISGPFQVK